MTLTYLLCRVAGCGPMIGTLIGTTQIMDENCYIDINDSYGHTTYVLEAGAIMKSMSGLRN